METLKLSAKGFNGTVTTQWYLYFRSLRISDYSLRFAHSGVEDKTFIHKESTLRRV